MRKKTKLSIQPFALRKPKAALVWVGGFAIVGTLLLLLSHAAPLEGTLESELGNLSGMVSRASDQTAANAGYVAFGVAPPASNCSLAGAVFCEDFEEGITTPAAQSGDWNPSKISTSRFGGNAHDVTSDGPSPVLASEIPACRSGSVKNPFPPGETLICNPSSVIQSHYGLTSTASQNYGDNSYRIGQPFDIAGRTGTIQFDADIHMINDLFGYATMVFSDEPSAILNNHYEDNARNAAPRNGIEVALRWRCSSVNDTANAKVFTYTDYRATTITPQSDFDNCTVKPTSQEGYLNRVVVKLSQTQIQVYISDYSNDGINFGTPKLLYTKSINLPFTRGYINFGGHNHASIKYTDPGCLITNPTHCISPGYLIPSITVLWDNISFDGPLVTPDRMYQVPDNGTIHGDIMDLGWYVPATTDTPMTPLTVTGVNLSGMTTAKLSTQLYINVITDVAFDTMRLQYRVNNGTWHSAGYSAGQLWLMNNSPEPPGTCCPYNYGINNMILDVNPSEFVNGTNTIQFQQVGMSSGYRPVIANVDLLLR